MNSTPKGTESSYNKRLAPASDSEIIRLAEKLWAMPELRKIFQRVLSDGDTTEQEEGEIDAAIEEFRQGPLWDRDKLHLALAPCLLRQLAAGNVKSFDQSEIPDFLAKRKVQRAGPLVKVVPATAAEVVSFARTMQENEEIWKIYLRVKFDGDHTQEEEEIINTFLTKHVIKFGLYNVSTASLSSAFQLLRRVAEGMIVDLDSADAIDFLRSSKLVGK